MVEKEARENYLRAIHELDFGEGVRCGDIAKKLGVNKASVSEMIRKLESQGFIDSSRYSKIKLTARGKKHAGRIKEKHDFLKDFMRKLIKDEDKIKEEACKLEHALSDETAVLLRDFLVTGRIVKSPAYVG